MGGAVSEIDQSLQIVVDPVVVDDCRGMPHVRDQAGIAIAQMHPAGQFDRNAATASAAAAHNIPPVPVIDGQVHAEIVGRVHIAQNCAISLPGRGRGDKAGFGNPGGRTRQLLELAAGQCLAMVCIKRDRACSERLRQRRTSECKAACQQQQDEKATHHATFQPGARFSRNAR